MSFINKLRKVFPTKKVNVNELERSTPVKSLIKPISTVHIVYNDKLLNEDKVKDKLEDECIVVEREILPEIIACPKCSALTIEGLDYCDNCGCEIKI